MEEDTSFYATAASELLDHRLDSRREVAHVLPALLTLLADARVAKSSSGDALRRFLAWFEGDGNKASATTGIVRCGWLRKVSGHALSTHRRWVVLDGTSLMYYTDPSETELRGVLQLKGARVRPISRPFYVSLSTGGQYAFELTLEEGVAGGAGSDTPGGRSHHHHHHHHHNSSAGAAAAAPAGATAAAITSAGPGVQAPAPEAAAPAGDMRPPPPLSAGRLSDVDDSTGAAGLATGVSAGAAATRASTLLRRSSVFSDDEGDDDADRDDAVDDDDIIISGGGEGVAGDAGTRIDGDAVAGAVGTSGDDDGDVIGRTTTMEGPLPPLRVDNDGAAGSSSGVAPAATAASRPLSPLQSTADSLSPVVAHTAPAAVAPAAAGSGPAAGAGGSAPRRGLLSSIVHALSPARTAGGRSDRRRGGSGDAAAIDSASGAVAAAAIASSAEPPTPAFRAGGGAFPAAAPPTDGTGTRGAGAATPPSPLASGGSRPPATPQASRQPSGQATSGVAGGGTGGSGAAVSPVSPAPARAALNPMHASKRVYKWICDEGEGQRDAWVKDIGQAITEARCESEVLYWAQRFSKARTRREFKLALLDLAAAMSEPTVLLPLRALTLAAVPGGAAASAAGAAADAASITNRGGAAGSWGGLQMSADWVRVLHAAIGSKRVHDAREWHAAGASFSAGGGDAVDEDDPMAAMMLAAAGAGGAGAVTDYAQVDEATDRMLVRLPTGEHRSTLPSLQDTRFCVATPRNRRLVRVLQQQEREIAELRASVARARAAADERKLERTRQMADEAVLLQDDTITAVASAEVSSQRRRAGVTLGDRTTMTQLAKDSQRDTLLIGGEAFVNAHPTRLIATLSRRIVSVVNTVYAAYWRAVTQAGKPAAAVASGPPAFKLLRHEAERGGSSCNPPAFHMQLYEYIREVLVCSSRTVSSGDGHHAADLILSNPAVAALRQETSLRTEPIAVSIRLMHNGIAVASDRPAGYAPPAGATAADGAIAAADVSLGIAVDDAALRLLPPLSSAADLLFGLELGVSTSIRYCLVDPRGTEAHDLHEDTDVDASLAEVAARLVAASTVAAPAGAAAGAASTAAPAAAAPAGAATAAVDASVLVRPAPTPYSFADVVCRYDRCFPWRSAAPSATISLRVVPYLPLPRPPAGTAVVPAPGAATAMTA